MYQGKHIRSFYIQRGLLIILFISLMTQFGYAQDSIPPAPKPSVTEEVVTPSPVTESTEESQVQPEVILPKKEENNTIIGPPTRPIPVVTPQPGENTRPITTPTTRTRANTSNENRTRTSVENTRQITAPVIIPDINNGEPNPFTLFSKKQNKKRATKINFLPKGFVQKIKVEPKSEEDIQKEIEEPTQEEIQEAEKLVIVPVDTSDVALNSKNPFGVRGTFKPSKKGYSSRKIAFNPSAGAGTKQSKQAQRRLLFDTSKVNSLESLKFGLLLFILGLLAILMSGFREDANNMYKAFISNNMMVLLLREKGHLIHIPYVLTYLMFSLSAGTFIYLMIGYFNQSISTNPLNALSLCVLGVMCFFLLKHFLLGFIGFVFPFGSEITLYNFSLGIFNGVLGIILIPFIAFLAFAPSNLQSTILYLALIMLGIFYLYRLFRYLGVANKFLVFHKFHFFVYLCTVEIAPMVILLKYILS